MRNSSHRFFPILSEEIGSTLSLRSALIQGEVSYRNVKVEAYYICVH